MRYKEEGANTSFAFVVSTIKSPPKSTLIRFRQSSMCSLDDAIISQTFLYYLSDDKTVDVQSRDSVR